MKELEEKKKIVLLHSITIFIINIFSSSKYFFNVLNISLCESEESF